ncbi:hypothetical protein [Aeromonas caviae]|uniref:hypothetical protein n=1 Tax=Aeromonas caviae TaxID=648 RepID=UPI003F748999
MSLLAALAKGLGAGTVDNARVGFAEQQRVKEAAQRKEEQAADWASRDGQLEKQLVASREDTDKRLAASQADTELRLKAQTDENAKQRAHDWALFESKLAAETKAAASNASLQARETHAKNIMGTFDKLAERKSELLANDKITDEQRGVALGEIDALIYTLSADKGAQQLLSEFGGAGYAQYGLSLAPPQPEPAPDAPDSLLRPPEVHAPMRRPGSDGPNAQPSKAFSAEQLGGVLGKTQQQAKANVEEQRRAQLQGRSGSYMGAGYDPKNRVPVNVTAGQPVKLVSEFSLPSSDSHVPVYARYGQ